MEKENATSDSTFTKAPASSRKPLGSVSSNRPPLRSMQRLTLVKPKKPTTAVAKHPNPFTSGNLYYDDGPDPSVAYSVDTAEKNEYYC